MTDQPRIIRTNRTFDTCYKDLQKNDVVCGQIRLHPSEEPILTHLVERGIRLIPSATTQLLSKSKVLQTRLLGDFMPASTLAVYNFHDLLKATAYYQQHQIGRVILKLDRKNGGLGIHLFDSIESLYNQVSGGGYPFPFVIQPYIAHSKDVRVIILDDYVEAYQRHNPNSFRNNLHCGGESIPTTLDQQQLLFCREVMEVGRFPYAHIDLLLFGDSRMRLIEINLRGGLRGAKINSREYRKKTAAIHEMMLEKILQKSK